jgi:hypothetical protein
MLFNFNLCFRIKIENTLCLIGLWEIANINIDGGVIFKVPSHG